MDPGVKKQRRRSVRNIRKSISFVPPSVEYGSAWIGENQETNICNLARSLEDLHCQDEAEDSYHNVINIHVQNDTPQYDGDEACDGFHFDQPNVNSTVQHSADENSLSWLKYAQLAETHRSPVTLTIPSLISSVTSVVQTDMHGEKISETERLESVFAANQDSTNSHFSSTSLGSNPKYAGDRHDSPCNNLYLSNSFQLEDGKKRQCHRLQLNDDDFEKQVLYQRDDNEIVRDIDGRDIVESEISYEKLERSIDKSEVHCQYSNSIDNSRNNSMSPEFADFSFCQHSAESSPSINQMNEAKTSLLDVSSSSAFNMSFSPMEIRPNTPNTSPSNQSINANEKLVNKDTTPDQLRKSISHLITSLEEPVISADPTFSQMFSNKGIGVPVTSTRATTLPSISEDTSFTNELNKTYTISSADTTNIENNQTISPVQINSKNLSSSAVEELQVENMGILDFDFVKTKRSKRRTSNLFTPIKHVESCFTHSSNETSIIPQEDTHRECSMEFSSATCSAKDESISDFSTVAMTTTEEESTHIKYSESTVSELNNGCPPEHEEEESVIISCNESISPSRLTSTLSDCGNRIATQEKPKAKKSRRKSNSLARLIEESEKFVVPQSCSQNVMADLQCVSNDKENEIDQDTMAMPDSCINNDSNSSHRLRTRRSRKSWDFRKESQAPVNETSSVKDSEIPHCILDIGGSEESFTSFEIEDLHTIYSKQKYVDKSPQPLETIKENGNDKSVFNKRKLKRYLNFGSVTEAKEKKRMKKALNVYKGRQCYFPVTEKEFDRKMLDVQLILDSDLEVQI